MKKVAVVPVYNEANTIIEFAQKSYSYIDFLIFSDDGSTDDTYQLLKSWAESKTNVWILRSKRNYGMACAYKKAFAIVFDLVEKQILSWSDIVITIDADMQHEPVYIDQAIKCMQEHKLDLLITKRNLKQYPLYKIWGNIFLSFWARFICGFSYKDVESGYKFIKIEALKKILLYYTGYRYSCAQEIGVVAGLLNLKIDNDFEIESRYVSGGTRLLDGFFNMFFGVIAYLRVKFKIKNEMKALKGELERLALGFSLFKCIF